MSMRSVPETVAVPLSYRGAAPRIISLERPIVDAPFALLVRCQSERGVDATAAMAYLVVRPDAATAWRAYQVQL